MEVDGSVNAAKGFKAQGKHCNPAHVVYMDQACIVYIYMSQLIV